MMLLFLSLCCFATLVVLPASAQKQLEGDERCVTGYFEKTYPTNWRVLLDSHNYKQLVGGSDPTWQKLDQDGQGEGWTDTGRPCQVEPYICDYLHPNQSNWLITPLIRFQSYRRQQVFVNITYDISKCQESPKCNTDALSMHYYLQSSYGSNEQRNPANYVQFEEWTEVRKEHEYQRVFSLITPRYGSDRFYIGIKDSGTCGSIQRMVVYSRVIPMRVSGLLRCPEVILPPYNSTEPVQIYCNCQSGSYDTNSMVQTCYSNGTCIGNLSSQSCYCRDGYWELQLANGASDCRECPRGSYRSRSDPPSHCLPCPFNTMTQSYNVLAKCPCLPGYYRTVDEGASDMCTSPPSTVRYLKVKNATSTTLVVEWDSPIEIGRSDYYYNVEYKKLAHPSSKYSQHNRKKITNTTEYSLDGLTPATYYSIRISVHNGVSELDPEHEHERQQEITATTKEGLPSVPVNIQGLCTAVVWGAPPQPNGNITSYDMIFYRTNNFIIPGVIVSERASGAFGFHIVQESDKPPGVGDLHVRVRAVNSLVGAGEWSKGTPLVSPSCLQAGDNDTACTTICPTCPTCPTPTTCPPTHGTQSTTQYPTTMEPTTQPTTDRPSKVRNIRLVDGEVRWDSPSNPRGEITAYLVRIIFRSSGDSSRQYQHFTIRDPSVRRWRPDSLPSERPIYVQVRAINSAGRGPYSSEIVLSLAD